ncbi:MAG: hypothetical protein IPL61_00210 [Myxococcales bacterium]|nr:hypothetical protein [Myxococcales bacterium]
MIRYDTRDWFAILRGVRGTVLPRIAIRVLMVAGVGLVGTALRRYDVVDLAIPGIIHTMVGVALGLLLVFRTNASYDRYWEGRRLVGAMVNNARDLVRQGASYLAPGADAALRDRTIALYVTIRRYLRDERTWPELEARLPAALLAELAAARCPPLVISRAIGDLLAAEAAAGRLSEHRLVMLDQAVSDLIDALGGCERILRTPVPFAYAHHIKGFLTLFCLSVPMALLPAMGWATGPAAAVVAYALFGIDEIGVEIEDPFGYDPNDLPLEAIGDNLAIDVEQALTRAA